MTYLRHGRRGRLGGDAVVGNMPALGAVFRLLGDLLSAILTKHDL